VILAQPEIRKAVADGEIKFDPPLEEKQWGEASINLRLGTQFTKLKEVRGMRLSVVDGLKHLTGFYDTLTIEPYDKFGKRNSFCLEPNEFVLALTHESITIPNNLIGLVEGRSTYARVGLSMHQTAPWIQPGWSGPIVLEIKNHGALRVDLYPILDQPCQLSFMQLTSSLPKELAYGGKSGDSYANQKHPLQHPAK
jgi:dCTP deaminase